jgi:dihydroorotate dehydrogenase subfamily 1
MPRMLNLSKRINSFDEVALPVTLDAALAEANRCLLCEDAPCETGCPTRVQVRDFIRRVRFEDFAGAYRVIAEHNVLAGSTARVCDTCHQCAERCTRARIDRPIDIGGLQRFAADWAREHGLFLEAPSTGPGAGGERRQQRVAVVGAGPAGLSCAAELARLGYAVELFEREAVAGGTIRHGVPSFRLPGEVVAFEVETVKRLGVELRCGQAVSDPRALLASGHAAVFLGVGLDRVQPLGVPGEELPGVFDSRTFLKRARDGSLPPLGDQVVVVGGGDTAIDCATVARRLTPGNVTVLYRRGDREMPARPEEITAAREEGIDFRLFHAPLRVEGDGKVERLVLRPAVMPVRSGEGRARPQAVEGADYAIPATCVVTATGTALDVEALAALGVKLEDGRVLADEWMETSVPGLFVGGDAAGGRYTVVDAVAHGRRAAFGIHRKLTGQALEVNRRYRHRVPKHVDLSTECCGVRFPNPFVLAAAPPSDELDMVRDAFRAGWAGAVLKTTSVEGTPVPLKYPMMEAAHLGANRIQALTNIDLISEHHVDEIERRVRALKAEFPDRVVIPSIMGAKKEDWQSLVVRLEAAGADMIECSFSCPQGTLGSRPGFMLGQDPDLVRTVAGWVKQAARRIPVVIKITPQVADIVAVAQAVKDSGADGICASNTIPSLIGVDLDSWRPRPTVEGRTSYGGLSGPAIRPISLRNISEITKNVPIDVSGTGGPVTWRDALEFLLVGVKNVQFCTAVMQYGYGIIDDLIDGLGGYLAGRGLTSVRQLIGGALPAVGTHDELTYGRRVVSHIDRDLCVGCLRCLVSCRDGGHRAISAGTDRVPVVDEERCVGCNFCSLVCPVAGAIRIS